MIYQTLQRGTRFDLPNLTERNQSWFTKPYREEPVLIYQTLQRGTSLDLRQSWSYYFSFAQLYIPSYSKTSWQNETKVSPVMKQNQRQKSSFRCTLLHFMTMYHNSLCRYCQLWSLFVSPQLKNRFVESKRLSQQIKHRFAVCISYWRIQNLYKEMDVIRSLFDRYIACNLHRVAHDNGGWRGMSMTVATERRLVERLSWKGSSYWNKSCLIHSKNSIRRQKQIQIHRAKPIRQNERKSVCYLIQWQEFWIHLMKFDATKRKLNRQYEIQHAVAKIRFFAWYNATKCDTAQQKLDFWRQFRFVPYYSYVTWLYHIWH